MISARKINANRANARASTGPKTAEGRARAARNALRHGLSLSVHADPSLSEDVETLAREIAGTGANSEMQELARRIAEAQIDLRRVRCARHGLLSLHLGNPEYDSRANERKKLRVATFIRRRIGASTPMAAEMLTSLRSKPEGPHKVATILSDMAHQLSALDRYERRALSRRKFAIRAFDVAARPNKNDCKNSDTLL
jgi:hypothetical protein